MAEDNNKMEQLYIQRYDGLQFDEIPAKIDCIKDKEEQDKMRVLFCNELLYAITSDYTKYDSSIDFNNNPAITLFKNNVRKLRKDKHFYWAMYYFYCNNNEKCLAELQAFMEKSYEEWRKDNNSTFLNEASLIDCLIINSEKKNTLESEKAKTLEVVKAFIDKALTFPKTNGYKMKVPEAFIEAYVNSIKACNGLLTVQLLIRIMKR